MKVSASSSNYALIGWLLLCFYILLYSSSLYFRFLDVFFVGDFHGRIGSDFFAIPRGFLNLLHDENISRETNRFGPYGTWYAVHPILALLIGSWLSLFEPFVGFGIFVFCSICILILAGYVLSKAYGLSGPCSSTSWVTLALVASPPIYLLLWNAQMHIFVVLGCALLIAGLITLQSRETRKGELLVMAGLLSSLFSKPLLLPVLPMLVMNSTTRKPALASCIIYTIVSALCFLPFLNPHSLSVGEILACSKIDYALRSCDLYGNISHWLHIVGQSNIITYENKELFGVLITLSRLGITLPPRTFQLLLFIPAVLPLMLQWRSTHRLPAIALIYWSMLVVLGHLLSYTLVWEYHFTTLLPFLTFLITQRKHLHRTIGTVWTFMLLLCILSFYLPTPYGYTLESGWIVPLSRTLPTAILYLICLYLALAASKSQYREC